MKPLNIKTNHIFVHLCILIIILAAAPAVLSPSISVSPTLYELRVPPGQSFTDAIRIVNVGKTAIMVKVYLSDFEFNTGGNIQFLDAGTGKYPLVDCLRVNPTSLDLEPGEDKFVRFTVTMPENETGELHGLLFFQTMPKNIKTPAPGKQVMVSARIGAAIYAAAKNTATPASEITGLFFKQVHSQNPDNSSFHYALIYHNKGNIHLRPTGKLKILDAAGKEVASTPVNENKTSVLRDSYRIFEGDFKNKSQFRDGTYKLVAEIDYGKEVLETEKPVYLRNTGGIESFEARLTLPGKDHDTARIVFSAVTKGIEPAKDKDMDMEKRQQIFRIKPAGDDVPVNIPAKSSQGKDPQTIEYTAEWTGPLKPGSFIAEFLVPARENEILTSYCLIDNTGGR